VNGRGLWLRRVERCCGPLSPLPSRCWFAPLVGMFGMGGRDDGGRLDVRDAPHRNFSGWWR
jgi:hypothetical protein